MVPSLLTAANWPIVGQLCWILGKVMNFIYNFLDKCLPSDSGLVGLSIILYTIFVYTLLLPLTIKQQRTSKMSSVMNPEIQAIQKKYKNKKDQASMMKQQEEIQQVYDKYGTSMSAGCLPLLIQMPLLFALYPVIYNIQKYVPEIKTAPKAVNVFLTLPDLTISPMQMIKNSGSYGFPAIVIIITAILLPVLSGLTQYGSIKLSQAISGQQLDKDNPMASTMNTMNITMPLFSVFMVFSLPTGIGLYWIVSAVVRCVQQVFINKHLSKISVEEILEQNKEKAEEKQEEAEIQPEERAAGKPLKKPQRQEPANPGSRRREPDYAGKIQSLKDKSQFIYTIITFVNLCLIVAIFITGINFAKGFRDKCHTPVKAEEIVISKVPTTSGISGIEIKNYSGVAKNKRVAVIIGEDTFIRPYTESMKDLKKKTSVKTKRYAVTVSFTDDPFIQSMFGELTFVHHSALGESMFSNDDYNEIIAYAKKYYTKKKYDFFKYKDKDSIQPGTAPVSMIQNLEED